MKSRHNLSLLAAALLLSLPALVQGATRFAAPATFGTANTAPYDTPFTASYELQAVLDLSASGDTVLVAGVTISDFQQFGTSFQEGITIPEGVVLIGGWDLTRALAATDPRYFDEDSLWSVISPLDGRAVTFAYDSTIASFDTLTIDTVSVIDTTWSFTGPGLDTRFERMIVRDAIANLDDGAGVYVRAGSPTIHRNVFINCQSNAARGGCIFVGNGSPAITNNTIAFCRSQSGSGVLHVAGGAPTVRDNIFYTTTLGFGVACSDSGAADVSYNAFYQNNGNDISGCDADNSNLFGVDPVFCGPAQGNYSIFAESQLANAASDGGVLGARGIGCRARIKYVSVAGGDRFPYNTPSGAAKTLEQAVALALDGDTIRVGQGVYTENLTVSSSITIQGGFEATLAGTEPTPLLSGGGVVILNEDPDRPALTVEAGVGSFEAQFLVFAGTPEGDGGAISLASSDAVLKSVTITGHASTTNPQIDITGTDVRFRYCMIVDNRVDPASGSVAQAAIGCAAGATVVLDTCNLLGNDADFGAGCSPVQAGTRNSDPLFCNPAANLYTLLSEGDLALAINGNSPIGALGQGCNSAVHYIALNGEGAFPYNTPGTATSNIDTVFTIATAGDTIRFGEGRFVTALDVRSTIVLEGGWNDAFDTRDIDPATTILSGDVEGAPTILISNPGGSGGSPSPRISGFVITHEPGVSGPGVVATDNARPFLNQNMIVGNTLDRSLNPEYRSAGIHTVGEGTGIVIPTITHNTVVENVITNVGTDDQHTGAGLYAERVNTGPDRFTANLNVFYGNEGGSGGFVISSQAKVVTNNVGWANLDSAGVETNFVTKIGGIGNTNVVADPVFCDPAIGNYLLSTCSPAASRTYSVTGDTVAGALPISPDCICDNNVFRVYGLAAESGFPFRGRRNAARRVSTLAPYLSPGDTVKVSNDNVTDAFELLPGVIYLGGYQNTTFLNSTRLSLGRTRVGAIGDQRLLTATTGVDSTTFLDGFDFASGRADSGAGLLLTGTASPKFNNCRFIESRSDSTGAAVLSLDQSAPIFQFVQFWNNVPFAEKSSVIKLAGGGGSLRNVTISNNKGSGWAIDIENCAPEIFNTTITRNVKGVRSIGGAGTIFDHNNIFGHRVDTDQVIDFEPGEGNISQNPLYCNAPGGTFSLFDHSPLMRVDRSGTGFIGARGVGCNTPVHYVSAKGSNTYPYNTPEMAAHNIQDAINVGVFAGLASPDSVDDIRVEEGTYIGNVTLPTNVKLRGGYGSRFVNENRAPSERPTMLQGDSAGTVVSIAPGARARTPIRGLEATVLSGFIIEGGDADDGGGVAIGALGAPFVRTNVIRNNTAIRGGGIFADDDAIPSVTANVIYGNTADLGAGIFIDSTIAPNNAIYRKNTLVANTAGSDTAGVVHANGASVLFKENVVAFSGMGAGIRTISEIASNIDNNLFFANPGGDTLTASSVLNPVHVISDPRFCDAGADDYRVIFDIAQIRLGTSALRDSCAETWWGALGAGCTEGGHRFLVRPLQPNDNPVFPYVCKENAANNLMTLQGKLSPGDTIEVARSPVAQTVIIPYTSNLVVDVPVTIRGGWDLNFTNVPNASNPDSTAPNPDRVEFFTYIRPAVPGPIITIEESAEADTNALVRIDSHTVIEGFIFQNGNSSNINGGAIRILGGAGPTIQRNVFESNVSNNWGGAISIRDGVAPRIRRNYFARNRAGIGGAIYLFRTSDPVVEENIFASNVATEKGTLRMEEVTGGRIGNNVFLRNAGGGISLSEPLAEMTIWNNAVTSSGGYGIALNPTFAGIREPTMRNNNVWANSFGNYRNLTAGEGSISAGPLYCNTSVRVDDEFVRSDFFKLQECSPMIGAGTDPVSDRDANIGSTRMSDPICSDRAAPRITIGFFLHPTISGIANVQVVPNESIARDSMGVNLVYIDRVALPDSIDSQDDSLARDTVSLDLRLLDPLLGVYTSDNLTLRSSDSLVIRARGVDLCGSVGTSVRVFSSLVFDKGRGGVLASVDKRAWLSVDGDAVLAKGAALMEVVPEDELPADGEGSVERTVTDAYAFSLSQLKSTRPAVITMSLAGRTLPESDLRHYAVYRLEDETWTPLGSTFDKALNRVSAAVTEGGTYAVRYSKTAISTETIPSRFALHPNMPNPFNPITRILFDLPVRDEVKLEIYDVTGRLVRTLQHGALSAGRHDFVWNGDDQSGRSVASGVYFYKLSTSGKNATRKMLLIR